MINKTLALILLTLPFIKLVDGQNISDKVFIDLTLEVINIKDVKSNLITETYEGKPGIFIKSDSIDYVEEVQFNKRNLKIYFWTLESLFFYQVDYWMEPDPIFLNNGLVEYRFKTGSFSGNHPNMQGKVMFHRAKKKWKIKDININHK